MVFLRRTTYELPRLASRFQKTADAHPRDLWDKVKAFAEAHGGTILRSLTTVSSRQFFTSESRFSALNLKDHRISEGHKISLKSIEIMHKRAAEENILFITVLIPTKELVFKEFWRKPFHKLSSSDRKTKSLSGTKQKNSWTITGLNMLTHYLHYVTRLILEFNRIRRHRTAIRTHMVIELLPIMLLPI